MPRLSLNNFVNKRNGHEIFLCERLSGFSVFYSGANFVSLMKQNFVAFLKNIVAMNCIPSPRNIFKIVSVCIRFVSIKVVDLMAFFSWAYKCSGNSYMDRHVLRFSTNTKRNKWVSVPPQRLLEYFGRFWKVGSSINNSVNDGRRNWENASNSSIWNAKANKTLNIPNILARKFSVHEATRGDTSNFSLVAHFVAIFKACNWSPFHDSIIGQGGAK